jgi:putative DNA primase/helicase
MNRKRKLDARTKHGNATRRAGGNTKKAAPARKASSPHRKKAAASQLSTLNRYSLTDMGNAQRFIEAHKDKVMIAGTWHLWDGTRWKPADDSQVLQLATETVRLMEEELEQLHGTPDFQAMKSWVRQSQNRSHLRAMLALSCGDPRIVLEPSKLDNQPMLLNLKNGTLDLESLTLRSHEQHDLLTRVVPVDYRLSAKCPRFRRFVKEIFGGSTLMTAYVQRALGYGLLGRNPENALFVLQGDGANGKSVLLNTIRTILGPDYAIQGNASTLIAGRRSCGIRDDLANLRSYRFVAAAETGDESRLDEALVKQITGGEPIRCRLLYGNEFEYDPQFSVYLATNYLPVIQGVDRGIWRRIHLIPFAVSIPEDQQDRNLPQELAGESEGILQWLIEGLTSYREEGLAPPDSVKEALQTYRANEDTLGQFIKMRCETGSTRIHVGAREIYTAYAAWTKEAADVPLNVRQFKSQLQRRGFTAKRVTSGIIWQGIQLR